MDLLENNPGAGGDGGRGVKVEGAVMKRGRPWASYWGSGVMGTWGIDELLSIIKSLKN